MTRSEKWLLAGLGLSLAVNGLLAAMILFHPGPHRHHGPEFRMGRMEDHLAPESRDLMKATVERHRDEIRTQFEAMRDVRDTMADALTAEPLDRAAMEAAFEEINRHHDVIRGTIQQAFMEAASELPRDERIKLARGGERLMRRMFRPDRKDGRDDRKPGVEDDAPRD
jgi:uncharacterized membrane protein